MRRAFFYVDNEAAKARACLISMNSSVSSHRKLLKFIGNFSAKHSTFTWIECRRVLTPLMNLLE